MYVLEIPIETSFLILRLHVRIFETYISGPSVLNVCQILTHTMEGYRDAEILINFQLPFNNNNDAEHDIS